MNLNSKTWLTYINSVNTMERLREAEPVDHNSANLLTKIERKHSGTTGTERNTNTQTIFIGTNDRENSIEKEQVNQKK